MTDPRPNAAAGLLAAMGALRADQARREKSETDIMRAKRNAARAMPGSDPRCVADLDALFELAEPQRGFPARWIGNDEGKTCRAAIRALHAERRAALFMHCLALKSHLGWSGELETYVDNKRVLGPEGDTRHFEKFCEGVLIALCETGFPVDAALAARTLDWLAHHRPRAYHLEKVVGLDYAMKALGAVKAIAQAAAKGMALPESARRDALALFDRYHGVSAETRDALLGRGQTLEPGAEALLEVSGHGRQDTFFQRMRSLAPTRAAMPGRQNLDPSHWTLYLDFHAEVRTLVDDVKRGFADAFASPSWLNDPERFRTTFEVSDDEMAWPWWTLEGESGIPKPEVKSRPGFTALPSSEGLRRIADPAFRPYNDEELEGFRRFAIGETNPSPFTFDGAGAPDIAAFTFEGADPEGRFLDHLVGLDATKPSSK